MEFFKKRVRKYPEKKLDKIPNNETAKIREEISFNKRMIEIWQRNEEKLIMQMNDVDN